MKNIYIYFFSFLFAFLRHHTVALCTVLCHCPNHSFSSHRYSSVRRHFPPNLRTSSEQLNAMSFAHHCLSWHKWPDDVAGSCSEAQLMAIMIRQLVTSEAFCLWRQKGVRCRRRGSEFRSVLHFHNC
jgi:hypothetical protein